MTRQSKYLEQWQRVTRWYKRVKEISEGTENLYHSSFQEDDLFAFFLNCYHLKDWIKNDPSAVQMKPLVETFVNQSEALSICADLCNGLKHLSQASSRSGQDPQFGDKTRRVFFTVNHLVVRPGYTIVTNTKTFDALDLAWACIMDWQRFIYLYSGAISSNKEEPE